MPTITSFGPDAPLSSLPAKIKACVTGNASTADCDDIMTAACAEGSPYEAQTYCACMNAPTPAAACFFAPCTNNAFAYVIQKQRDMVENKNGQTCPANAIICNQILEVGGSDNVVSGNTMQCGIITNVQNIIKASPYLAVLLIVLVLLLVMVIAMKPDDAGGSKSEPLPPEVALSLMEGF